MKESKMVFGIAKVGEKGQIVIPKEARKVFDINTGDNLIVLGDTKKGGMAIIKASEFTTIAEEIIDR